MLWLCALPYLLIYGRDTAPVWCAGARGAGGPVVFLLGREKRHVNYFPNCDWWTSTCPKIAILTSHLCRTGSSCSRWCAQSSAYRDLGGAVTCDRSALWLAPDCSACMRVCLDSLALRVIRGARAGAYACAGVERAGCGGPARIWFRPSAASRVLLEASAAGSRVCSPLVLCSRIWCCGHACGPGPGFHVSINVPPGLSRDSFTNKFSAGIGPGSNFWFKF